MTSHQIDLPADFADEDEVELSVWIVEDGTRVEQGQVVAEVATAKAEVEIVAPTSGVLRHGVEAGALLEKLASIGVIDDE
jgi:pyruvate/2-oxoglutarate dehydrogenase complex dihydrolipoamide acyltransferase (E2) component